MAVDGEVTAIDSAGFGPITITQSVTITSPAGVEAGIQAAAGGNAITINARDSNVTLQGLTLEGAGVAFNGIVFNMGDSLTVTDCVVQNFLYAGGATGNGILMQPPSGPINPISFVIANTNVSNNGNIGIYYFPPLNGSATATVAIDHVVATNNVAVGISINTVNGGGATTVAVSNSVVSNNSGTGIYFENASSALQGSIDNSTISGNLIDGVDAETSSDLEIGRSVITYNGTGILNNTSPNRVYSYQDNRITRMVQILVVRMVRL